MRHISQPSVGFKVYMLRRYSCLDTFTVSIRQLCTNLESDACGPTLLGVVATGRRGQLTLVTLAPPPILVDSDGPGPAICNCVLPLHQGMPMFKTLSPVLDLHAIPCLLIFIPMRSSLSPWGAPWKIGIPQVREDQTVPVKRAGPFLCIRSSSILNVVTFTCAKINQAI